jgi:signal transduction histidine kinase
MLRRVQSRVLVLLAVVVAGGLVAMALQHRADRESSRLLIQDRAEQQARALDGALTLKGANLEAFVRDFTFWDDMVRLIATGDRQWALENVDPELDIYQANVVWIMRNDGSLVYSVGNADSVEYEAGSGAPLPLTEWCRSFGAERFRYFFAPTRAGLLEVRGATVHPTSDPERKSQPRGYMFAGRLWSAAFQAEIAQVTGCWVTLKGPGRGRRRAATTDPNLGTTTITHELNGLDGRPVAALEARSGSEAIRSFSRSSLRSVVTLTGYSLALLLLLAAALIVWVSRPLILISRSLATENPALIRRLQRGRTEFGQIARLIRNFFEQKAALLREMARRERAEAELVQKEKLATLGQVAGSVAHELRNPLGVIRNAIYYLNLTEKGRLAAKSSQYLQVMDEQIDRSNKIVTALLDFAQGRPAERQSVPLTGILDNALARLQVPAEVSVVKAIPSDLPALLVDPAQIQGAFANIMQNAIQAMPEGGTLTIEAGANDAHATIKIQDTGCGIAPENMPRLFEPLFSTRTVGVGLGLPISRNSIVASGGRIEVESEPGEGSTFTVTLPLAPSAPARAAPPGDKSRGEKTPSSPPAN